MVDLRLPKNPAPDEGAAFEDKALYVLAFALHRASGGALDWGSPVRIEFRDFNASAGAVFEFRLPTLLAGTVLDEPTEKK